MTATAAPVHRAPPQAIVSAQQRAQISEVFKACRTDFSFYAPRHLFITDKITRRNKPFRFNETQRLVNAAAERQLQDRGYVRLICVKARQQGVSTYTTGRGYWRTTLNRNWQTSILTHELKATKTLFEMVRKYHENCPAAMRPAASSEAANSLEFRDIGSAYHLQTARTSGSGRGLNAQFFHGSEVAFWRNMEEHLSGVGQAIALAPNTEIYLESTGNGRNQFYTMTHMALKGEGVYEVVFSPWFLSPEYTMPPTEVVGFELSDDDYLYQETYGLTLGQMAWRAHKIASDFLGDPTMFDQEYPASIARAFRRSATETPFIRPLVTETARRREHSRRGPLLMGVDPSEGNSKNDRFAVILRDDAGVVSKHLIRLKTDDQQEAAGAVLHLIQTLHPDCVFVDRIGIGAGICDILAISSPVPVVGVKASEAARNSDKYFNKRAEMWGEMREWLIQGASLLPDDELEVDLQTPSYDYRGTAYVLESKQAIARRNLPSPDFADALSMTFYLPFALVSFSSREALRSGAGQLLLDWRAQ